MPIFDLWAFLCFIAASKVIADLLQYDFHKIRISQAVFLMENWLFGRPHKKRICLVTGGADAPFR